LAERSDAWADCLAYRAAAKATSSAATLRMMLSTSDPPSIAPASPGYAGAVTMQDDDSADPPGEARLSP
jgi:hypothetical protein